MPPKEEVDPFDFDANMNDGDTPADIARRFADENKVKEAADKEKEKADKDKKPDKKPELTLEEELEADAEKDKKDDEKDKKSDKDKKDDEKDKKSDKDKKPDKDESIKILRQERDDIREKLKVYEGIEPEIALEIKDMIAEKFGEGYIASAEEIRGQLSILRESDKEVERLKGLLETQDKKIADIDIRSSDAFNSQYVKPYNDASEVLYLEIAKLGADDKALAPMATGALHQALLQQPNVSPVALKQMLSKFSRDFQQESGMEYPMPALGSLMTTLGMVHKSGGQLKDAYDNWKTKREETIATQQLEQQTRQEQLQKSNKSLRKTHAVTALRGFGFDAFDGLADKKVIQDIFNEEFSLTEGIIEKPETSPPYGELIVRGVKAKLCDRVLKEFRDLKKKYDALVEDDRSTVDGKPVRVKTNEKEADWAPAGTFD